MVTDTLHRCEAGTVRGVGGRGTWELWPFSAQLFCKPKTPLNYKVHQLKRGKNKRVGDQDGEREVVVVQGGAGPGSCPAPKAPLWLVSGSCEGSTVAGGRLPSETFWAELGPTGLQRPHLAPPIR